ncbi:MAG: glycosyltransferase [Proteobacteria bacterium]|nr:glycosyltransferase [Pseudomonadota bacterium]
MAWIVVAILAVASLAIGTYSVAQLHLLWLWYRSRPGRGLPEADAQVPRVTVQLPLYNEADVAERLIRCIGALDWPAERLEIQVLDDSTDRTVDIVATEVARLRSSGVDAVQVRREDRAGYKAGALRNGMKAAHGELIAIFDADFLPRPDFLRQAVACLGPDVGLVQGRWGHLNRDTSAFTRAQAFHLDAHFTFEQHARCRGGLLMGFNGTAGVWRRSCIEDAGGWNIDTLTEDLDLSYRAQLAGWGLRYVDALEAPAELPEDMAAIRAQQHRWMRGGAQVAHKLLGPLWRSDEPFRRKLQGTAHLLGSSIFLAVLALAVINPLIVPVLSSGSEMAIAVGAATAPLRLAVPTLLLVYLTSCIFRDGRGAGVRRTLTGLPMLLLFCNGLSLHNSVAVLQGWFGGPGEFLRTPKRGDHSASSYRMSRGAGVRLGEWVLCVWSVAGLVYALDAAAWTSAAWLAFQAVGFLVVQRSR